MWDFFRSVEVVARKPYRCAELGCEIKPGDRYNYNAGKIEGDLQSYRLCLVCALIAGEAVLAVDAFCEGYPLGVLRDSLRDELGVDDAHAWAIARRDEGLARVAAAAARKRQANAPAGILGEIAAERLRQVEVEGWSPEHDDEHSRGELAVAASTYALWAASDRLHAAGREFARLDYAPARWPWPTATWWKPTDRRRDLVKAAALIVAEIERLDRGPPEPEPEPDPQTEEA